MVRLLLVLLLAAVLWVGWGRGEIGATTGADEQVQSAADALSGTASGPGNAQTGGAAAAASGAGTKNPTQAGPAKATPAQPRSADPQVDVSDLLSGLDADSAPALAQGYARLTKLGGAARQQIARALDRARQRAADVVAQADVLGFNNAFLHCAEGRVACRAIVDAAADEDAPVARAALTKVVEAGMRGRLRNEDREARAMLDSAYAALRPALLQTVLNPAWQAGARTVTVAPGQTLDGIAKKLRRQQIKIESGTLMALNRIGDPRKIRPGQKLKVPVDPIVTVVEKRSFTMAVYVGSALIRLYRVAHGREGRTPEAEFTIGVKKENPDWYSDDGRRIPYGHPENVLGDYWVEWKHDSLTGFGTHGTSDPASIGTMASAGCIRMSDEDISDYFRLVPRGSKVVVRSSR